MDAAVVDVDWEMVKVDVFVLLVSFVSRGKSDLAKETSVHWGLQV